MPEFIEAVAVPLVPIVAIFSGVRIAAYFCEGIFKGPFVTGSGCGGASADENHPLEVAVPFSPLPDRIVGRTSVSGRR